MMGLEENNHFLLKKIAISAALFLFHFVFQIIKQVALHLALSVPFPAFTMRSRWGSNQLKYSIPVFTMRSQ